MKMKGGRKMRGFMCQSPSLAGACMANNDPLSSVIKSTIINRRRTFVDDDDLHHHHARFTNKAVKYTKLAVEPCEHTITTSVAATSTSSMAAAVAALPSSIKHDHNHQDDHKVSSQLTPLPTTSDQLFQVVVMRVSLHCQGCAGKVKRHLSKMEGVTSFSIDLESKRVTVTGNVSPVGVLESISKVKRAEFWPC